MNRRKFLTAAAGGTAAALLPSDKGKAQTTSSKAAHAVHATATKLIVEQFHALRKNPGHNIFASGKVSTAFRMHSEVMEADGTNAAIAAAICNGGATVYTKDALSGHYSTLAKMGVHLTAKEKDYATSHLIASSTAAVPLVQSVAARGTFVQLQQAAHSTMLDHQFGRVKMSAQISVILTQHSGVADAVFYHNQKPHLRRVDDEVWVYADGWDSGDEDGDGGSDGMRGNKAEKSGPGGGGGTDDSDQGPAVVKNGKDSEIVLPSGARVQACTVYYSTLAMMAGVGGGSVALVDAVGIEVGIAFGAGVVISAPVLIALCAILVAVWGYLAVVC